MPLLTDLLPVNWTLSVIWNLTQTQAAPVNTIISQSKGKDVRLSQGSGRGGPLDDLLEVLFNVVQLLDCTEPWDSMLNRKHCLKKYLIFRWATSVLICFQTTCILFDTNAFYCSASCARPRQHKEDRWGSCVVLMTELKEGMSSPER